MRCSNCKEARADEDEDACDNCGEKVAQFWYKCTGARHIVKRGRRGVYDIVQDERDAAAGQMQGHTAATDARY